METQVRALHTSCALTPNEKYETRLHRSERNGAQSELSSFVLRPLLQRGPELSDGTRVTHIAMGKSDGHHARVTDLLGFSIRQPAFQRNFSSPRRASV